MAYTRNIRHHVDNTIIYYSLQFVAIVEDSHGSSRLTSIYGF